MRPTKARLSAGMHLERDEAATDIDIKTSHIRYLFSHGAGSNIFPPPRGHSDRSRLFMDTQLEYNGPVNLKSLRNVMLPQ